LPRFRFVGEVATVPDPDSAVASVREHRFQLSDFDAIIRRTDDERLGIRSFDETAKVISVDDRGSEIIIEYDSPRSAFLVAAGTADRDWRARVDDDSIVIRETALGQMGLELPPGQRRVVLRLRNPAVLWGAGLSLLALTLGGISTLGGSASHE
jgi:hypothetical protein